ncbi:MAG: dynamin family protein [Aquincola sp.]|nr:dynamin family protein [Aquincola sp.]MDH4287374.1 dynamin family protein [Aquincola sp.]MDH5328847.1 dynamin family protein [Aquincola sp.]
MDAHVAEPTLAGQLDALAAWRRALDRQVADLSRFLHEHEVGDEACDRHIVALRERLATDRLCVAFVAEFSRGKSELINAIFFADTGRRILPATPGRTTMCPVELGHDAGMPPVLALLPIDTRLEAQSLSDLRAKPDAWTTIRLDPHSPERLADALTEVMRTKAVTVEVARALGFWRDDDPDDNPPMIAEGLVEVPAWRHAAINYPHPLLQRGLVVLDTPGLNAIGAEPELTLSLLPAAHAVVFILGADTGVTKSDLAVWRDHLGGQSMARFVVLNKIDALADPLLTVDAVSVQIAQQVASTARTLEVDADRVFPLSARQALAGRIDGDPGALAASRLPALEDALGQQLLPHRREVIQALVTDTASAVEQQATRRLSDQRRQIAEQMLELRGLRGKSSGKVQVMIERVDGELREFERCTERLVAMRAVHTRMLREQLAGLASDALRDEISQMQDEASSTLFNLGARKAFLALCNRLRLRVTKARERGSEIHDMLNASFRQLNSDFGFALSVSRLPSLERTDHELNLIERSYVQYLGLSHALRLAEPRFMEQFRRMLLSKLRMTFENASGDIELWHKSASNQVDSQLRERRRAFKRRRESLERIQLAAGDLDARIADLEAQDQRLQVLAARVREQLAALRDAAASGVHAAGDEPESGVAVLPSRSASASRSVAAG